MRTIFRLVVAGALVWVLMAVAGVPAAVDSLAPVRRAVEDARAWADRLPLPALPGVGDLPQAVDDPDTPVAPDPGRIPSAGGGGATSVEDALDSVVRVLVARCGQGGTGSGFAVGGERIMTNAHVVQGASRIRVETRAGDRYAARVVKYDARSDVAVLAVPGIDLEPLAFAPEVRRGTAAYVAGHPLGGPLKVVRGSVRSVESFGDAAELRSYVVGASVQPGNSGGPLLTSGGDVLGLVYARAASERRVGLARTAEVVADDAEAGLRATREVGHGRCPT